jgi:23S rRNA (uracil1939-C5)-methyltransferase
LPSLPPSTPHDATPGAGVEAEIEVTALGLAGDGIGHLEGHTVFVPYSAPGDRLRIRLEGEGEGGWRARILERPQTAATGPPPLPQLCHRRGCACSISPAAYRRKQGGLVPRRSPAAASNGGGASVVLPPGGRRRAFWRRGVADP